MSYVVNDALDELFDLIAAWLWPNGEQDRQDGQAPIDIGAVSPLFQRLQIDLTDEQKRNLEVRIALGALAERTPKVKQKRPMLALSNLIQLDNLRSEGLLGRLVAQYWAGARARAWYQVRCGSMLWDDDSPTWNQREKQLITDSERREKLKDPEWFGVAIKNKHFLDRWDGGKSKSTKWRRRYSLEATFSNWSAPPWFEWYEQERGVTFDGPGRWGGDIKYYDFHGTVWFENQGVPPFYFRKIAERFDKQNSFLGGTCKFSDMMNCVKDAYVFHGYKEYVEHWDSRGSYSEVGSGPRVKFREIPWRTYGKHVTSNDRKAANYKLKNVLGTQERTNEAIKRYYRNGYYIVRTALDVMLARAENPESFPGFAEHCEWWHIACPDARMISNYPDLSAIGVGVIGMQDVSSLEIAKYVMMICPKPGTVPPWEDKGPLWTWPDTLGTMECLSVPLQFKERKEDTTWGTINQYILSVETSLCANIASGIVSEAVNTLVDIATNLASEWLQQGMDAIMKVLEDDVGSAAWDSVKELIKDVSQFGANIARFADAEKLVKEIVSAANLPVALTDYLDTAADGVVGDKLNAAKDQVQSQIDSLRRQWDWADDLIGSASSMGTDVKNSLRSMGG
jgi:hypothetical protein